VQRVLFNFEDTNSLLLKPRSGRPKILTRREERAVVNKVKADPKISAPKIASNI